MDATIVGENQDGVGVDVVDNNGRTIEFSISKNSGEIVYQQSGYPDKMRNRTCKENVNVAQAREFAKYYTYKERGIKAIKPYEDVGRIEAVRRAIEKLSDKQFEEYFDETYRQLRSHHEVDTERPVTLPDGVSSSSPMLYQQDVYLGLEAVPTEPENPLSQAIAEKVSDLADALSAEPFATGSEANLDNWAQFQDVVNELVNEEIIDLPESLTVAGVSDLHVVYANAGHQVTERGDQPFARPPDARLDLVRLNLESLDVFRRYLDFHLRCQIRDRYVLMGLLPPKEFQVMGLGSFEAAKQYAFFDGYPRLDDSSGVPDESLLDDLDAQLV